MQALHYELFITLSDDFYKDNLKDIDISYSGSITIQLNVPNDNNIYRSITLNAYPERLDISGVSVERNKTKVKGISFEFQKKSIEITNNNNHNNKKKNNKKEKEPEISDNNNKGLIINFEEPLAVGKYEIRISFKGIIVPAKKAMSGLYYCLNSKNNSKVLCSHFETHFAHYVFPCFDQWEHKSTFQLHVSNVNFTNGYKCISNTNYKMKNDVKKLITFNITPKMSAYLIALFIGQFESVETNYYSIKDSTEIPISVYFLDKTLIENANTTLNMSLEILPFLEEYFDQSISKQEINKIDWLFVPDMIISGGMENWGACSLVEKHTANSSMGNKKLESYVELLAHELSHFWVGNLVGFDLHIKEGLAQYFEKIITDKIMKRPSSLSLKKNNLEKKRDIIKEIKQETSELSNEQKFSKLFSGVGYAQYFDWLCNECIAVLGQTTFQERLKAIIEEYEFGFVSETEFVNKIFLR
ncbi:hypothetical protein ABK040_002382 [Willaertia magna]